MGELRQKFFVTILMLSLPSKQALMARERAVENWLHAQVLPAYDALKANPSRGLSVDQIRTRLGLDAEV